MLSLRKKGTDRCLLTQGTEYKLAAGKNLFRENKSAEATTPAGWALLHRRWAGGGGRGQQMKMSFSILVFQGWPTGFQARGRGGEGARVGNNSGCETELVSGKKAG